MFFEMSLLLPNAFGHSYSLCKSTVLRFGCLQPLPTCRCLNVLLAKLSNYAVEMSAATFGTGAKWHLCVSSSKIDSLVDRSVRGIFPAQYVLRRPTRGALAAHSRSLEMPWS